MHLLKSFHLRRLPLLQHSVDHAIRVTLIRARQFAQQHVSCVSIVSTAGGCGGDAVPVFEVIPSELNDVHDHRQNRCYNHFQI